MNLVILGAGGYGRTVRDVAEQIGYKTIVLDDASEFPLSSYENYVNDETEFIPAFGNNNFRMEWISKIQKSGGKLAVLIHPTAYISPKAIIGPGTVILPKSVINTDVTVNKGCIINIGAIVDHGCIIEEGVHICCGAIVKGENKIQSRTKIEAGQIIELRQWPV